MFQCMDRGFDIINDKPPLLEKRYLFPDIFWMITVVYTCSIRYCIGFLLFGK